MKNRRPERSDLDGLRDPALSPLHTALTGQAGQDELGREREALAAYRAVTWDRRGLWRPAVFATKLGVATAAGVIGLSGVATAAYTGSLPSALQDVAHKTIKAPAAHPKTNGVGPDATGPAAWGLCNAFVKDKDKDKDDQAKAQRKAAEQAAERAAEGAAERAAEGVTPKATPPGQAKKQSTPGKGHGQGNGAGKAADNGTDTDIGTDKGPGKAAAKANGHGKQGSVAYRNLVRAAGGEDKLEAYCATIPRPSGEPEASEEPRTKPSKAPKPSKQPASDASHKPARTSTASPVPSATTEPTESASPAPSAG